MNGDFEEENICSEYNKNCAPEGWISTSLFADYYFDDALHAFSGTHFVGLVISPDNKPLARNFLRSRLLCGLRKDAKYNLAFYVRSAHNVLDSIGIFFTPNDLLYQKEKIRNSQPQLYLQQDRSLNQSGEWQKVSLVYTASGNENFIAIGDFRSGSYRGFSRRPDLGKDFYFFLDKISLTPLNPAEKLCSDAEAIKEEEYEFNVRHDKLDRLIYYYTKKPPPLTPSSPTIVQRIDTLVIPDVLFATNSYIIHAKAKELLDAFSAKTRVYQIDSVVVEGHTDNQGSFALNQKLSENRAASVAQYLQPNFKQLLQTRGWASEKPVADNRTTEGRQKNRRVEIYVYVRE